MALTLETGVFYRHIFMVSCLKLFNKRINTHGESPVVSMTYVAETGQKIFFF